jgi:hypothetical protein
MSADLTTAPRRPTLWRTALLVSVAVVAVLFGGIAIAASGPAPQATPTGPSSAPSVFVGTAPVRVLDTRSVAGGPIGVPQAGKLGPNSSLDVAIAGAFGIPDNAVAVAVNVTLDEDATLKSFLTIYPLGQARPNASTNNAEPGLVMSNSAIFQLGNDGMLAVYNQQGTVNVIIDVTGYFLVCAPASGGTTTTTGTTVAVGAPAAEPDCAPMTTPIAKPALVTDAATYKALNTVTYHGTGWTGCTAIKLDLIGPGGSVIAPSLTPDADGTFTGTFLAPNANMNYLLHAAGTGPSECTADATFTTTALLGP